MNPLQKYGEKGILLARLEARDSILKIAPSILKHIDKLIEKEIDEQVAKSKKTTAGITIKEISIEADKILSKINTTLEPILLIGLIQLAGELRDYHITLTDYQGLMSVRRYMAEQDKKDEERREAAH